MGRRGWRTASVLGSAVLLAVGLAGCGGDDDDTVSAYNVRSIADGDTYRFDGIPAELEGGRVAFTLDNANGGEAAHELQIIQVDEGTTFDEVKAELLDVDEEGQPLPGFIGETGGGIGSIAPGARGSVTQELDEGTYVYFCGMSDDEENEDAPSHYDQGEQGTFTVDGSGAKAERPDTVGTVTAKEYGFEVEDLKAGDNIVEFKNDGKELHHLIAAPVAEGASVEDALAFFQSEEEPTGPPPVDFERIATTAVIGAGQEIRTSLSLTSGQYVMACFISDRAGGPPHIAQGMLTTVQVE